MDASDIEAWDEGSEMKLEQFCLLHKKIVEKVVPKISQYFRRVEEFSYSSSEVRQLLCRDNRYFQVFDVPGFCVSSSILNDDLNLALFELKPLASSLISRGSPVKVEIRVFRSNTMHVFENVSIGHWDERGRLKLFGSDQPEDNSVKKSKIKSGFFRRLNEMANEIMKGFDVQSSVTTGYQGQGRTNYSLYQKKIGENGEGL